MALFHDGCGLSGTVTSAAARRLLASDQQELLPAHSILSMRGTRNRCVLRMCKKTEKDLRTNAERDVILDGTEENNWSVGAVLVYAKRVTVTHPGEATASMQQHVQTK
jgi:hypothetical protein